MKITKLTIDEVLGIKHLEFEAGKFNVISGKNGEGKTSVIEALKAAIGGGNDATLLRHGATEGEIVLVLDDGTEIHKAIKGDKTPVTVYDKDGYNIAKPQNYLNSIFDMVTINPISFFLAEKKDRVKLLLECLPLKLDKDKVFNACADTGLLTDNFINLQALDCLNKIENTLMEDRKINNRYLDEKVKSISQLKESLVEIDFNPDDLKNRMNEIEEKLDGHSKIRDNYLLVYDTDEKREIDSLRVLEEVLKKEYEEKRKQVYESYQSKKEQLNGKFNIATSNLKEEKAGLTQKLETVGGVSKTKELINQYNEESIKLTEVKDNYDFAISQIRTIRIEMLDNLPIKGLEIKAGEIFQNDIPFERLNTEKQLKISLEIAKLRAGTKGGFVCFDGLERLDTEQADVFVNLAEQTDLQFFVTYVNDNKLELRAEK